MLFCAIWVFPLSKFFSLQDKFFFGVRFSPWVCWPHTLNTLKLYTKCPHLSLICVLYVVCGYYPAQRSGGVKRLVLSGVRCLQKKLKLRELEPITISKHEGDDQIRRILACVYLVEQYSGSILSIFSLSDYQCLPPFLIRSSVTPTAWIRSYSITVYYR